MIVHRLVGGRLSLATYLGAVLAATCLAGDAPKESEKLPEDVTAISKAHLTTKVPNFFSFDYPFDPEPGKRLWLRVDDKHFLERYPDGSESRFEILGHAQARKMDGTVAVKIDGDAEKTGTSNDRSFQVFIPDKGNDEMQILYRRARGGQPEEWIDVAASDPNKRTIIQNVE